MAGGRENENEGEKGKKNDKERNIEEGDEERNFKERNKERNAKGTEKRSEDEYF